MLISMTGYGEAQVGNERAQYAVEVRAVNNKYLKISTRLPETHAALESEIEKLIRDQVRRGTVNVSVRLRPAPGRVVRRINQSVFKQYLADIEGALSGRSAVGDAVAAQILNLPGVFEEPTDDDGPLACWPTIAELVRQALAKFEQMRQREGSAMQQELLHCVTTMRGLLKEVTTQTEPAIEAYRGRLQERIATILQEQNAGVQPGDLIREVAIYAERSDINEEIARLGSHLDQFEQTCAKRDSEGRRLEFLAQEMLRETNTMGSKTGAAEITRRVVDLKTQIERLRELVLNIE